MSVYTLILEYNAATYMSQVEASDEKAALIEWAEELDVCTIDGFPLDGADQLLKNLEAQALSPVVKLVNVWNLTFVVGHDLAILHLIKTELQIDG
ncbi:hypothetical protein [Photobacterium sp.]|uniref:hypothetical protein n=1 Tax=Photobacterium sp. TaxID=660 RepID=UPI00299D01AC|nr:hypothetical protein [Photobacterium sp.]MDX1302932.1 hypothetical protein [Photobacterium sp.]